MDCCAGFSVPLRYTIGTAPGVKYDAFTGNVAGCERSTEKKPSSSPLLVVIGCSTVPYTDRTRLMMMSESEDLTLGLAAYQEVLSKREGRNDPEVNRLVQRVGERIARSPTSRASNGSSPSSTTPKTVNAFALPGGKVAVYTGLFPVAQDEAGLATVIGHEVAHALARHGAERMSQGMALQTVGVAPRLRPAAERGHPAGVMQAYGLGAQVGVMLPFSRGNGVRSRSHRDHPDGQGRVRSVECRRGLVGANGGACSDGPRPGRVSVDPSQLRNSHRAAARVDPGSREVLSAGVTAPGRAPTERLEDGRRRGCENAGAGLGCALGVSWRWAALLSAAVVRSGRRRARSTKAESTGSPTPCGCWSPEAAASSTESAAPTAGRA